MAYTNEQRAEFLETASEIGITRAMRRLGYPAAWSTGKKWFEDAGIEAPLDEIKQQAREHRDWYETEDMLLVAQEGISRVYDELQSTDLTPDEHKKMSEAFQKYANTWLTLHGKANNISETRHRDNTDLALMDLINEERMRNDALEVMDNE
jgi:hypothetical protein